VHSLVALYKDFLAELSEPQRAVGELDEAFNQRYADWQEFYTKLYILAYPDGLPNLR
jgi:hypothetical protein